MKVRLFNREYLVETVNPLEDEELGDKYIGKTFENKEHIIISEDMSLYQEKSTLMHELIHCVLYNTGHEHDELVIDALSCGFINLLLLNPELYEYIIGNDKIE